MVGAVSAGRRIAPMLAAAGVALATVAATGALSAAMPAAAEARAPAWRPLGTAIMPAVSDDSRWVAWQPDAARTALLDTRTGRRSSVPTPPGCASRDGADGIVDLGGGQLLWRCGLLLDLATRAVHAPAGLPAWLTADAVGSQWIHGTVFDYHAAVGHYINWHTGEDRIDIRDYGLPGPHITPPLATQVADLSLPGLNRSLCAPLRRDRAAPADPGNVNGPPYLGFQYAPPYGISDLVEGSGGIARQPPLRRCGSPKAVPIPRCASLDNPIRLTRGLIACLDVARRRIVATRLPSLHSWRIPIPAATDPARPVMVISADHAVISIHTGPFTDSGRWRMRIAHVPR